jgi:hypothetical protein
MKSSLHSQIPFCNCQFSSIPLLQAHILAGWPLETGLSSIPLLQAHILAGWRLETQLSSIPLLQAHILAGWRLETELSSISLLSSSYPGRLASRNSTQFFSTELFFITIFHGPRRKTQPLYCWEVLFTAPLHSNGSYSIVACVFVA